MQTTQEIKMLDAVTATTTSSNYYVGDCTRIAFLVTRSQTGIEAGTSTFTFKGGMTPNIADTAPTMVSLNVITTNAANANTETILRTTGGAIANDSASKLLWLDLEEFPVEFVNCTVTETTDGVHTAWLLKIVD